MRKLLFATLPFILFVTAFAWADNRPNQDSRGHENDTTATEMTLLGVAAASILGAGAYVVRRARSRSRGREASLPLPDDSQ